MSTVSDSDESVATAYAESDFSEYSPMPSVVDVEISSSMSLPFLDAIYTQRNADRPEIQFSDCETAIELYPLSLYSPPPTHLSVELSSSDLGGSLTAADPSVASVADLDPRNVTLYLTNGTKLRIVDSNECVRRRATTKLTPVHFHASKNGQMTDDYSVYSSLNSVIDVEVPIKMSIAVNAGLQQASNAQLEAARKFAAEERDLNTAIDDPISISDIDTQLMSDEDNSYYSPLPSVIEVALN